MPPCGATAPGRPVFAAPPSAADAADAVDAVDAVAVRRWDEQAKEPDAHTPSFARFRPLLAALTAGAPALNPPHPVSQVGHRR